VHTSQVVDRCVASIERKSSRMKACKSSCLDREQAGETQVASTADLTSGLFDSLACPSLHHEQQFLIKSFKNLRGARRSVSPTSGLAHANRTAYCSCKVTGKIKHQRCLLDIINTHCLMHVQIPRGQHMCTCTPI
jgi:hypothetical protein